MSSKYNIDTMELSCINSDVENTLLEVATGDLKEELLKQGFILNTSVLRENTSTEKREFTVNGKSKYTCNTTIQLDLSAVSNNKDSIKYIENIAKDKKTFIATFERDYTITENDLGTHYWVYSLKITSDDLKSEIEQ
ncbi:hypothetical protein C0585_07280 [Candidatus Woesearchaeota archaeon]|nr:MAG: hypothetical protein C0585_07280 [Candidatus Woesearchaeota archaeon]